MLVLSNVVFAIAQVLATLMRIYFWIIIAAAVVSWVRPDPYNPIVRTLYALTEPVLYRVRKWLPFTYISGIDFSPVVVLIVIQLIENIVIRSLVHYAASL
jgi:YggT family protein